MTGVQTNDHETLTNHVDLHVQQEIGEHQGFHTPLLLLCFREEVLLCDIVPEMRAVGVSSDGLLGMAFSPRISNGYAQQRYRSAAGIFQDVNDCFQGSLAC